MDHRFSGVHMERGEAHTDADADADTGADATSAADDGDSSCL